MAYDLHFQLVDPTLQASYGAGGNFTLSFERPLAVQGLQKLVNRWLKLFLTPKGSCPIRRKEGTDLANLIGGNVDEDADLESQIQLFIEDANDQVQAIDRANAHLTSDERLRGATLTTFRRLRADAIEFFVEITSVSGRRAQVLIPYATG